MDYSRALLNLIRDGVVVCNPDGAIREANSTARRLLSLPGTEETLPRLGDLFGEQAWEQVTGFDYRQGSGPPLETEWKIHYPDRYRATINALVSAVFDSDRSLQSYVCLLKDISSQRTAEKELRRHRVWETGRETDHLADLSELLSRYRQLFESMGEGIVGVEVKDVPRFVLANPAAERLFGVESGGLAGRKLTDFCVEEDYITIKKQQARRQSGEISTYEMTLTRPDGERRTIQVTGSPLLSSDGQYIGSFSLLLDVTEQRQHEIDLEKSRNLLAHAHRLVNLGTWDWDIRTGKVQWSDQVYRLFGYEPQSFELDIDKVLSFFPEDTRGIAADLINRTVQRRESGEYEQIFIRSDGEERIFHSTFEGEYDGDGDVLRIIGTVQDITERKRAEEELRAKEARIQGIFRVAPTGIGMMVERELREVNELLCEMTGYSEAEMIGRNSRFLYASLEEYERIGNEQNRQFNIGGTGTVETQWVRNDGSVIDVLLRSTPLDPDDHSKGATFTALDITERIAGEQARLSLERQVQQTQKLESLGVLAGGIAHDFNNLLMAILGNADLALINLDKDAKSRDNIESIATAAQRASGLARQMLAYSGKGKFVIEPIAISALVAEMASLLEVSVSKKARLATELADDLPQFDGDANQIRQVVMNLITNASDALGDASGTITVKTGVMDCSREYLTQSVNLLHGGGRQPLQDGRYVFIEVSDSGAGMDTATRERIFEPFFTTKFTGRGLGLAAVIGIVNSHSGAIHLYSEPGQGSLFKVLFPVTAQAGPGIREPKPLEAASDWKGSGLVLVVDDDESVRRVSTQMYKLMGFEVITAEDGSKGVDVYREYSSQVRLVQLDLTMPRMSGVEAFEVLREINPDVRVLLSSGYDEQEATQKFTGAGLAGFIQKPFTYGELRGAVQAVVEDESPG